MAIRLGLLMEPGSPHTDAYLLAAAASPAEEIAVTDQTGAFLEQAQRQPAAVNRKWVRYPDTRALLNQFKPELALVSYAAYRMPAPVRAALEADCHVIAEKPGCVNVADFAALVKTADSKHRHLMLAVANRALPIVQAARTLIADGVIGRPYAAHAMVVADQTRLKSPAYQQSWLANKAQAMGGYFSWLSIHYLDLLLFLTRERFTRISALTRNANRLPLDVEDSVAANLAMTGGLIATLHGGYYLDRDYQSGFQLWGSDGWLRMAPHGIEARPLEWSRYSTGRVESQWFPTGSNAYNLFLQSAANSVVSGSPPLITSGEGLHLLETVDAAYRSAADGHVHSITAP